MVVTARSPQVLSDRCVRSILQCLVMSGKSSLQCHEMSAVLCNVCSILRHLKCHKHSAVSCNGCSFTSSLQCHNMSTVSRAVCSVKSSLQYLSSSPALSVWRDSEALRWLIDLEYFRSYQTTICYEFLSDKNCYWPSGWVFTAPRVLQPATRN